MVFLSQKIDGNIFADYWKVLVLTFSGMGNTVSFWAKKLMERWYLLITEKVLFWTFRWWEIRSFLSQEFDGKMIFNGYWEVLVLNFSVIGNTFFFSAKKLMEIYYMVFLSFPWYSKTSEIWFFAQWSMPQKPRNPLERSFVYKWTHQWGGGIFLINIAL